MLFVQIFRFQLVDKFAYRRIASCRMTRDLAFRINVNSRWRPTGAHLFGNLAFFLKQNAPFVFKFLKIG